MLYRQNGDRIVTIDSVTSRHTMYNNKVLSKFVKPVSQSRSLTSRRYMRTSEQWKNLEHTTCNTGVQIVHTQWLFDTETALTAATVPVHRVNAAVMVGFSHQPRSATGSWLNWEIIDAAVTQNYGQCSQLEMPSASLGLLRPQIWAWGDMTVSCL